MSCVTGTEVLARVISFSFAALTLFSASFILSSCFMIWPFKSSTGHPIYLGSLWSGCARFGSPWISESYMWSVLLVLNLAWLAGLFHLLHSKSIIVREVVSSR